MDLDPAVAARLRRNDAGLVPAIAQQHDTGEVLMLGWMDDEALARTLATGRATYWSRSRRRVLGQGRDLRPSPVGAWRSVSTATATPCCSRSTRRVRPATPARAPASTPAWSGRPTPGPRRRMADGRRLFGPDRPRSVSPARGSPRWRAASRGPRRTASAGSHAGRPDRRARPLAGALGLVALACWGVVLVTRGRVRRAVAALGAVVAVGLVVTAVARPRLGARLGPRTRPSSSARDETAAHVTGWWWVALVGSLLALAAAVVAVRFVPAPGPRWAAGTTRPRPRPEAEDLDDLDLWRAIDQGHDPTDPADH